jgi:hypothetical protein
MKNYLLAYDLWDNIIVKRHESLSWVLKPDISTRPTSFFKKLRLPVFFSDS